MLDGPVRFGDRGGAGQFEAVPLAVIDAQRAARKALRLVARLFRF